MNQRDEEPSDVDRLTAELAEQARRDLEDRLAREARHRWEESHTGR